MDREQFATQEQLASLHALTTAWMVAHAPETDAHLPYELFDTAYDGMPVANRPVAREVELSGLRSRLIAPLAALTLGIDKRLEIRMVEGYHRPAVWNGLLQIDPMVEFIVDGSAKSGIAYAHYSVTRTSDGWDGRCGVYARNESENEADFLAQHQSFELQDDLGLTVLTRTDCHALGRLMTGWLHWGRFVSPSGPSIKKSW